MNRTTLGWALGGIAGLLAVGGWILARHAPAPPEPPDATPAELKTLAQGSPAQQLAALKALATRSSRPQQVLQVHLVQRTPRGPLVVATCDPDSDDPPATHWLLPWPGVASKLAEPLKAPCLADSQYLGTTYRHRLLPLDAAGNRVLVLTTTVPRQTATSPGALLCWVGSLAVLLLSFGVSRTSGEV